MKIMCVEIGCFLAVHKPGSKLITRQLMENIPALNMVRKKNKSKGSANNGRFP